MTELQKQALRLRADDLTLEEIAEKMGCTRQNVSQLLSESISERSYARTWRARKVIYPNINKWLIEKNMSLTRFAKACGYTTSVPIRNCIIYGRNVNKVVIDSILKVTGMNYETAFYREDDDVEG